MLARAAEVDEETFARPENRAVLSALRESGGIEGALAQLDDDLADRLLRLSVEELPPSDRLQRAAEWEGCLRRLSVRRLRELKAQEEAALSSDAADESARADPGYLQSVNAQALEINERLRALFAETKT